MLSRVTKILSTRFGVRNIQILQFPKFSQWRFLIGRAAWDSPIINFFQQFFKTSCDLLPAESGNLGGLVTAGVKLLVLNSSHFDKIFLKCLALKGEFLSFWQIGLVLAAILVIFTVFNLLKSGLFFGSRLGCGVLAGVTMLGWSSSGCLLACDLAIVLLFWIFGMVMLLVATSWAIQCLFSSS